MRILLHTHTACLFKSFTALVDMLYKYIAYDYLKYGYICTHQHLHAEITVAIRLLCLAGGSYLNLNNVYCFSMSTMLKYRLYFIGAVNFCGLLKLKFPSYATEIYSGQTQSCDISSYSVRSGCVSAMNSLLVVIKCPPMDYSKT